ncbi:patellin-4-like [Magnolia sinica]|uniref:patellin-4-like n=1 Tax=Magnolia sinica TaxID=86752 RepID=UPI0026588058|nr:patellin-4-like [Magnolia sinica]
MIAHNEIASAELETQIKDSNPVPPVEENAVTVDLKLPEKKALLEFKTKLQEAILNKNLFQPPRAEISTDKGSEEKTLVLNFEDTSFPVESNAEDNLQDISLWGVPLLPSKNHEGTDIILLKFLRAREFKVSDAFEMLRRTLKWRKEFKTDGILEEDLGSHLKHVAYMNSTDKKGHPLCFNVYGVFKDKEMYDNAFGTDEKRDEFLRWRVQLMEKGIQDLNFKPGEVASMVQITDLKNSPGPAMKELRVTMKKALSLLQENYPEFVDRNIFINVPFRCYAYHALFSRFLTQRAKSKCIFARPSRVQETLLKYVAAENVPTKYGGLKRENDEEFSAENGDVLEKAIRSGGTETIEFLIIEPGVTVVWDMIVVGWEVTYKEEFIPDDDCSYKILIQKEKRMEKSVRNSFYINEPGKVVLTLENRSFKKKKAFYRSKFKPTPIPLYNFFK